MMIINKKIKDFAKEIHKREHSFVEGTIEEKHKLEEYYYLMASYIFNNLMEKIEESNIEVFNKIVDLEKRFYNLEESMKEISKQQKYLWQTLEEERKDKSKKEELAG